MGLMAGRMAAAERLGIPFTVPPASTAHGALINHITGGHIVTTDQRSSFQPMNVNFGLFPPVETPRQGEDGKRLGHSDRAVARKRAYTAKAKMDFTDWLSGAVAMAAE